MTRHLLRTGVIVLSAGYRTGRDLHWIVQRRLNRP